MRPLPKPQILIGTAILAALIVLPFVAAPFWTANILGRAFAYGTVALSLTFLATYGGFISLAQTMVAGIAGYTAAMLAPGVIPSGGVTLPYAAVIPLALIAATLAGLLVGAIAVRTRDIYMLMITLALAVGFSLFAQSNIDWFNGYEGIRNVVGPEVFGLPFRSLYVLYFVNLAVAVALFLGVLYLVRSPFGLVLQGIRDNARRVTALGFNVALHRIAAFGVAGFIAGCGGLLTTFYNFGISPGSVGMAATVNILVMAVIGGLGHPVGAFIGALIFVLMDTFAANIYDRERFNTLIGFVFLLIVLLSPDGVLGIGKRLRDLAGRGQTRKGRTPEETPDDQPAA